MSLAKIQAPTCASRSAVRDMAIFPLRKRDGWFIVAVGPVKISAVIQVTFS